MSNLTVSATTTPYPGVVSTTGSSSSTTVSNTSSVTTKTVTSSTTPSSSTTTKQTVNVATSSNTATMSSSTTYAYGSSASNSTSKMVSSTTVYATSSSTSPNVTSSSTTPNVTSSSTSPNVTSLSTTPQVSSSSAMPKQLYSGKNENSSELEMLDVTDDIIIDEPYTGNVSETMKRLIQMEYAYMSNPEEFAEHLEQEEQRIEELNSLKDEDVFAGMSYEEIIQYRYENAINEKCKALYEKHKNSIDVVNYNEKGVNHYNSFTNNIRLTEVNDMKNATGYASTYFHEVGHCLDDISDFNGSMSNDMSYDFYEVLKSDYEAYLNKVQEENGLTREDAYIWVNEWLKEDEDIKSAVSDILMGLSNGKIQARWGHDLNDYNKSMIAKEAFANFLMQECHTSP